MPGSSRDKTFFVLSLCILLFLYGYFAAFFGWFPSEQIRRAVIQGDQLINHPFYTEPLVYDWNGARMVDAENAYGGLTAIPSMWEDLGWGAGLRLIDGRGRTVHEWSADARNLFPSDVRPRSREKADADVNGSYVFPNGDAIVTIGYLGTARLDGCGEVLWRLPIGTHHALSRADDGSFWLLTSDSADLPTGPAYPTGYPGLDFPVHDDRIIQVSEHGEILREISILDVIYSNGLQRFLSQVNEFPQADLLHANDVEPLRAEMAGQYPTFDAGDLVVSLRNANLVFVFDPDTREVKWHASEPFVRQHDPDFMGGGWIGIFDNNEDWTERGEMLGGSRIVAIQPHTDSIEVLFPTPVADPFYTEKRGNWQVLDNGNLLLTEAFAGRVVEVAPDGRTVWEWVVEPYSESRTVELGDAARYDYSAEQIATWPCADSAAIDRLAGET